MNQSLCVELKQSNSAFDRDIPGRCFCQSLIQSWGKVLAPRESHSPLHLAHWTMLALSLLVAATEEKPNNVPYMKCARTSNVNHSQTASHNIQKVSEKHQQLTLDPYVVLR